MNNWLKSFFKKINDNEQEEQYIETKEPSMQTNRRETEAKVTYQYSSGRFRFPVIPDDNRESPSRTKEREPIKRQRPHPKRREQHERNDQQEEVKSVRVSTVSTTKKRFKRTDVPSPIYGYNKPGNYSEEKQYDFEHNREQTASSNESEEHPVIRESNLEPNSQFQLVDEDIMIGDEEKDKEDNVILKNESEYMNVDESAVTLDKEADDISFDLDQKQEQNIQLTNLVEEYKEIQGIETNEEQEAPRNSDKVFSLQPEQSSEQIEDGQAIEHSMVDEPHNFEITVDEQEDTNSEEKILEDKIERVEEKTKTAREQPSQEVKHYNSEAVPFNVLMSKKDRQLKNESENMNVNESAVTLDEEADDLLFDLEQKQEQNIQLTNLVEKHKEIQGIETNEEQEAPSNSDYVFSQQPEQSSEQNEHRQATEHSVVDEPHNIEIALDEQEDTNSEEKILEDKIEKVEEKTRTVIEQSSQEVKRNKSGAVPFNVLMSKKDRQKWEEGASKENSSVSHSKTIATYKKPQLSLLDIPEQTYEHNDEWLEEQRNLLNETLQNFNVNAHVVNVTCGPAVTRFEVQPERGVKVSKITNLTDDIKLNMAAKDIRMEAPIPGKNAIGIEVPNQKSTPVFIREILRSPAFMKSESPLTVSLGLDIAGEPIVTDLRKMPHGLIAGATGSGKSVCINSILISLMYKSNPEDVKLMLIDPKMVELAPYNGVPHLVSPVITDVKAATAALKWAVDEMERRYKVFHHEGVRDINRFNQKIVNEQHKGEKMPYLVIIIDELADLMMMSPHDVEEAVCRIAQKARACGIHLLLATQRPSVDVITGLIKANIPTRVAFSVSSQVDSRTIIDTSGAEKLLGKGDMLFLENGKSESLRIQGNFVSDDEIDRVVDFVKKQRKPHYLFEQEELIKQHHVSEEEDELFVEACDFVLEQDGASASSLQRRFQIGYNRAARLVESMEARGIVSPQKGSKPRDILVSREQLEQIFDDKKVIM
ncbi:DNA translocase FtsK [Bacillus solimangrovi]|uniref:FtsK domain-containing protein n=1 Tax=Bacillus solimangrovi TaxID=1305675 RepID=A0A1E5LCG8_9BACI|nr:DNA translocase FtsK [Bacillus solimangrovi]OEH91785.1 hypothetical protein BFG57_03330 [Bacillus solimangrovi]